MAGTYLFSDKLGITTKRTLYDILTQYEAHTTARIKQVEFEELVEHTPIHRK